MLRVAGSSPSTVIRSPQPTSSIEPIDTKALKPTFWRRLQSSTAVHHRPRLAEEAHVARRRQPRGEAGIEPQARIHQPQTVGAEQPQGGAPQGPAAPAPRGRRPRRRSPRNPAESTIAPGPRPRRSRPPGRARWRPGWRSRPGPPVRAPRPRWRSRAPPARCGGGDSPGRPCRRRGSGSGSTAGCGHAAGPLRGADHRHAGGLEEGLQRLPLAAQDVVVGSVRPCLTEVMSAPWRSAVQSGRGSRRWQPGLRSRCRRTCRRSPRRGRTRSSRGWPHRTARSGAASSSIRVLPVGTGLSQVMRRRGPARSCRTPGRPGWSPPARARGRPPPAGAEWRPCHGRPGRGRRGERFG